MKLSRLGVASIVALLAFAVQAQTVEEVFARVVPLTPADEAFEVRVDRIREERGHAAAFAYVEQRYRRTPRPHVAAVYAQLLLNGQDWGAPDGESARGLQLAHDALARGSQYAAAAIGWELLTGRHATRDTARGLAYLQQTAAAGNLHGMLLLGAALHHGIGTAPDPDLAEFWLRRAAVRGEPYGLFLLGSDYADGQIGGRPDLVRACELLQEAATRGSAAARQRLAQMAAAHTTPAVRADHLVTLWRATFRGNIPDARVRAVAGELRQTHPDDPEVLTALGRVYLSEEGDLQDFKQAFACFSRAAAQGFPEARAYRARMIAEGWGGAQRDPAAALAELRELEAAKDPTALAMLGYYCYWGSLHHPDLPKDAPRAFAYSQRAADAGDYIGQMNTAFCYESGIGVPKDYALAAKYYHLMASRGALWASRRTASNLAFAAD